MSKTSTQPAGASFKKKGKGSQTTGKQKGSVANTLQKYMCRSYKHPLYGEVMASLGSRKNK